MRGTLIAGALPFVGVRVSTLNATPTGGTDTAVARFDNEEHNNPSGRGALFDVITTAAAGTLIRPLPGSQGRYSVKARVNLASAGTVSAGLSIGLAAAPAITADPSFATGTIEDVALSVQTAADSQPAMLETIWEISQAIADDTPGDNDLRLILTNGAGAAPAAGDITLAQCVLEVRYLGQPA